MIKEYALLALMGVAKVWVVMFTLIAIAQLPLQFICYSSRKKASREEPCAGINKRWTYPGNRDWFSIQDILYQYGSVVLTFYWNLFTQPFSFM